MTHTVNVYTDTAANVKGNAYAQFTNEGGKLEKWWNGSHQVPDGFVVFFRAEANAGYVFDYWLVNSGGANILIPSFDKAITGFYAVTAFFKPTGGPTEPVWIENYLHWDIYLKPDGSYLAQTPYGSDIITDPTLAGLKFQLDKLGDAIVRYRVFVEAYRGWNIYSLVNATLYYGVRVSDGAETGHETTLAAVKAAIDAREGPSGWPGIFVETYKGWAIYRLEGSLGPVWYGAKGVYNEAGSSQTDQRNSIEALKLLIDSFEPGFIDPVFAVQGQGTIDSPAGPYTAGMTLAIGATPASGWSFKHFTRNGVLWTSANPGEFLNLASGETFTAVFEQLGPRLPDLDWDALGFGAVYGFLLALSMWASY